MHWQLCRPATVRVIKRETQSRLNLLIRIEAASEYSESACNFSQKPAHELSVDIVSERVLSRGRAGVGIKLSSAGHGTRRVEERRRESGNHIGSSGDAEMGQRIQPGQDRG